MEMRLDKRGFGLQNNTYNDIQGPYTCSTVRAFFFPYLFRVTLYLEKIARGLLILRMRAYNTICIRTLLFNGCLRAGGGTADGRRRNFARRLRKVKTCASARPYRG